MTTPSPDHGSFVAQMLEMGAGAIASAVVERHVRCDESVLEHYGSRGFLDLKGDTELRLRYLVEAVALDCPAILLDHVAWLKVAMVARDMDPAVLAVNLQCIEDELAERLPKAAATLATAVLRAAREHLATAPDELPSMLEGRAAGVDETRHYLLAVLEGRPDDALAVVESALQNGFDATTLYRDVLMRAQRELGRMWQMAEIHVAEEHFGTRVAERAMAIVRAKVPRRPARGRRVLCSSVGGDLHDVGIRAVADQLEWDGWSTIYLGASTPTPDLLRGLMDFECDLLALSTSVALQLRATRDLIAAVREQPLLARVPVLVGGAPFHRVPDLWRRVGADGWCADAAGAPREAARLIGPP